MKHVNFLAILITLIFSSNTLFAQELKITVKSLEEPIGHSYIYINGELKESANFEGVAYFPKSWLTIGDTISASFVGFEGAGVVYDEKIKNLSEVTISLSNNFILDEIVVESKIDAQKMYKKLTKSFSINSYKKLFTMNFDVIMRTDTTETKSEGEASMMFKYTYGKGGVKHSYKCPEFKAVGDTTNIIHILAKSYANNLYHTARADAVFRGYNIYNVKSKITYVGVEDDYRVFTYSSTNEYYSGQYTYYFDKDSGIVKKALFHVLINKDGIIVDEYKYEYVFATIDDVLTISNYNGTYRNLENNFERKVNIHTTSVEKTSMNKHGQFIDL